MISLNFATVEQGIDRAVGAFIGLFQRRNIGKMVVGLASAP
jgi:NADPH-dependent curcumin reductase CurA